QIHYYLPPLVLILAGVAALGPARRSVWWMLAGAILALWSATQSIQPLLGLLELIPREVRGGFEMYTFRIFTDLGLALASGLGLDVLLLADGRGFASLRSGLAVAGVCITVLIGLAIAGERWRQATIVALVVWIVSLTLVIILFRLSGSRFRELPLALGALGLLLGPAFVFGSNQPFNTSEVPSQNELGPGDLSGGRTQAIS